MLCPSTTQVTISRAPDVCTVKHLCLVVSPKVLSRAGSLGRTRAGIVWVYTRPPFVCPLSCPVLITLVVKIIVLSNFKVLDSETSSAVKLCIGMNSRVKITKQIWFFVNNYYAPEIMAMTISWVKTSWIVYAFLLLFRIFVGPFSRGYIHPDEFFQGGQELFFGCSSDIPWEFEPQNALRSVVPPTLMTWLPLQVYRWIRVITERIIGRHETDVLTRSLSGLEILVVPRIACSLFSIVLIDWSVWSICRVNRIQDTTTKKTGVPIPILLLASAWPTLAMLTRPFSNSMESYALALLMTSVFTVETNDKHEFLSNFSIGCFFCWKIGFICALGFFTRFTFAIFAFPILLYLLITMIQSFGMRKPIIWRKLGWMIISFACFSFVIIQADTFFYSIGRDDHFTNPSNYEDKPSLFNFTSFVVTPFNALAYNSKTSNLKDHGLHPRWTHAVVNMLIMYGPLALATYLSMSTSLLSCAGRYRKTVEQGNILMVSGAVVFFGLGFLSIAPHQEPRFLLPLLIPLVLLGEKSIKQFPCTGICVWALFNLILFALFGVLHQGGVITSLLSLGSTTGWTGQIQPASWIYLRTYMPPTFLTRFPRKPVGDSSICGKDENRNVCQQISYNAFGAQPDESCQQEEARVLDLKGSGVEKLWETLRTELPCSNPEPDSNNFLYLVVPSTVAGKNNNGNTPSFLSRVGREGRFQFPEETYEWNYIKGYGPHLTTEDFPKLDGSVAEFYNMLSLDVYNISCTETI